MASLKSFNKAKKQLYVIATYMVIMVTTIQVSETLLSALKQRKQYDKESYEEIIWDLVEDSLELNDQIKLSIEKSRKEIAAGKFYTHNQVKKHSQLNLFFFNVR